MRAIAVLGALCALIDGACAQGLTFTDASALFGPAPPGSRYFTVPGGTPVTPNQTFVSVLSTVPGQGSGGFIAVGDLVAASSQQSATVTAFAARMDRFADRFREGVALAGAINVLPPEPGRYLNISVGGAGYEGAGAGSVAVSARLAPDVIGYVGVAQGRSQTLVKGGVGWSPW